MGEAEANSKESREHVLLYQDAIDNIRQYKRQQFTVTKYGILLQVAIVALHEKFLASAVKPNCFEEAILSGVSLLVLIVSGALILRFHRDMVGCRQRMKEIRDSFEETSKQAWRADNKPTHTSCFHNIAMAITLVGVLFLGTLAVWWAMFR